MKTKKDIFALDLGTTKFCLALLRATARPAKNKTEIVSLPARGMKKGMLSDYVGAQNTLNSLLQSAERHLNQDIERAVVGISGNHLKGRIVTSRIPISRHKIGQPTLQYLCEKVESENEQDNRKILHTIPIQYTLDEREPVDNPIGFTGETLTGDFFLIDADLYYLKDIIRLCNESGLEVSRLVAEPLASASSTISEHYKELGVALVDIGGGTTDGLVFRNGKPCNIFTVNVAGSSMTHDIAIGFGVPIPEAEKIKKHFGLNITPPKALSQRNAESPPSPILITNIHGKQKSVSWKEVLPIVMPRAQELALLLQKILIPFRGELGAGVVLTGGGSEIKGITAQFERWLEIPMKKTHPVLSNSNQSDEEYSVIKPTEKFPTKFATVIGLISLEMKNWETSMPSSSLSTPRRYFRYFANWLREMS